MQTVSAPATLFATALLGSYPASLAPNTHTLAPMAVGNFDQGSYRAGQVSSPWIEQELAQLRKLQDRWHEFNADPIQSKTVAQLKAILSASSNIGTHAGHIVPGADGSLQAEWHLAEAIIGALVEDSGAYSVWVQFLDNGAQSEEFGIQAIDFLKSLATTFRLNV